MTKDKVLKIAQDACPYFDEISKGAFYEGFIKALDHVPDTTKMAEPEELVCVCGAIWQGQEMICPPRCLEEGIEREMPTDRGAWDDVPDATKWVDELRGGDETEQKQRERELNDVLTERDDAEDYIDALLDEVLGPDRAEWSSAYGRADALEEVRERIAQMLKPSIDKAWNRFEAALEQQAEPEQEPVACKHNRYSVDVHEQTGTCYDCGADGRMRFVVDDTAPPKREWVGLTDEEVNDLKHWLDHRAQWSYIEFARAIEAKLKEKNGG